MLMDRSFFQSSIILYEQQWILFTRVLISLKLNPDDDPDHQGLDQDKIASSSVQAFCTLNCL
jgi:hypothetical protein